MKVELPPNPIITNSTGVCPSFSDPSAAESTLQQASHQAHRHQPVFYMWLFNTRAAGATLWPRDKSSSMAVATLALNILSNSLQARRGVMLTEEPVAPSEAHPLTVWRW